MLRVLDAADESDSALLVLALLADERGGRFRAGPTRAPQQLEVSRYPVLADVGEQRLGRVACVRVKHDLRLVHVELEPAGLRGHGESVEENARLRCLGAEARVVEERTLEQHLVLEARVAMGRGVGVGPLADVDGRQREEQRAQRVTLLRTGGAADRDVPEHEARVACVRGLCVGE